MPREAVAHTSQDNNMEKRSLSSLPVTLNNGILRSPNEFLSGTVFSSGLPFFLVGEYTDQPIEDANCGDILPFPGDLGDLGKECLGEVRGVLGSPNLHKREPKRV